MQTSAGAWSRAVRSTLFACASVTLAVLAHVLGGEASPSCLLSVVAGGAVFAVCVTASGRERMFGSLALLMVATQAALHLSFMLLGPQGTGPSGLTFHGVVLDRLGCGVPGAPMSMPGLWPGWPMLAGHLLAALALAWGLRCGESAIWSVARLPVRVVLRLLRAVAPVTPLAPPLWRQRRSACDRVVVQLGLRLRDSLVLRGPPLPA